MGKYDHIIAKNADVQYKIALAKIAIANEKSEENRLKRISLGLKIAVLSEYERVKIETMLEEDLDLTDQA